MIQAVLIVAGLVGLAGPSGPAPEVLAEYNAKKAEAPETAPAQAKLADWCERNGLAAEAFTHYAAVVRLDPSRDAAWRKLGFKKVGGRWLNDEQIAAEAEQKKADRLWAPRLKKIHRDIHGGKKQAEAERALDEVGDPKAIPSLYAEFGGSAKDQLILVRVLGQIDDPLATKVIALLSVYGRSPEARRHATETLRQRKPDDYLPVLAALLADPIKYDVRPVGGPGSPGVLFVEGKQYNVRRVYAPPSLPNLTPMPGDVISYDDLGMPVLTRPVAPIASHPITGGKFGIGGWSNELDVAIRFSATQILAAGAAGAAGAQVQLQTDVAAIDRLNKATDSFNAMVMAVARDASGQDHGDKPDDWRKAVGKPKPKAYAAEKTPKKPTYDQLVPLAYVPAIVGDLTFLTRLKFSDG